MTRSATTTTGMTTAMAVLAPLDKPPLDEDELLDPLLDKAAAVEDAAAELVVVEDALAVVDAGTSL